MASWRGVSAVIFIGGALGAACGGSDFEPSDTPEVDSGTSGGSGGADAGKVGDPNGAACTGDASCASGHCADGVCCDTACDGTCESCATGTCTAFAAGTDPELECLGADTSCAGTCDGASACAFPGAETSCGETTCAGNVQSGAVCGGDGSCTTAEVDCAPFVCAGKTCTTSCQSSAECAEGAWCSAGSCETKKPNGDQCGADEQCESSRCAGGYCCASSCAAPNSCESGKCLCGTVVCAAGATCETWWADSDGDGFGAPSELDVVACSNQPPPPSGGVKYVASTGAQLDCLDSNKSVFPGQTEYFGVHRGDGSFDYDCNGSQDEKYKEVVASAACTNCGIQALGTCICASGYQCNPGTCAGIAVKQAFKHPVACGAMGTLGSCGSGSSLCGNVETLSSAQQLCR